MIIQNAKQKKKKITSIFGVWTQKLENNLESSNKLRKYESLKIDLELVYDLNAQGVRIRSKCDWYKQGKKSKKF